MVTIYEGDDHPSILKAISLIKKSYEPNSIYEIDGVSKNINLISDYLTSESLFSIDQLIIIKVNPNENFTFDLAPLISNKQKHVILYGSLNARYSNIKNIKKIAKVIKLEKQESSENFALCDAIFFTRNKKEAINIINRVGNWDESFHQLLSLMQTYVRNLVSKDMPNDYWNNLNPYFRSKFVKAPRSYNLEELQTMYMKLSELDVKSKSGSGKSLKALLTDFVIYSI